MDSIYEKRESNIPYAEFSHLHENSPRVIVSAGDFPLDLPEDSTADIPEPWKTGKVGNMSRNYGQFDRPELTISSQDFKNLPPKEQAEIIAQREKAADKNLVRFFEGSGVDPADVVIMKPQMDNKQPFSVADVDQIPRGDSYKRSNEAATMIYTRDKDRVLVALTGDSPFMIGHGRDKEGRQVEFMIHLGWRVEEAGYVRQSLEYARDTLGLDLAETHFVITPGAEKLDFTEREEDDRFRNPGWKQNSKNGNIRPVPEEELKPGEKRFRVSMVGFATDLLQDLDVTPEQIFVHGSDTTDKSTPYSSDRKARASNGEIPVTRDAVVARMPDYPEWKEIQDRLEEKRGQTLGRQALRF